jgi:Sulfotransferase family
VTAVGPRPSLPRPHILVVNGRKVREPVFIIGAPHSGTDLLARALKRSDGFHVTLGHRWVAPVVQGLARNPSIARGRQEAAATVLRDAFAQGWQVGPHSCLGCAPRCREASGAAGTVPCVAERAITRYGDATPELVYCAESLVDAFGDARLVQVIRDGRDVTAAMLADNEALAWFKPGVVNLAAETAHPLLGVESELDHRRWPGLSLAAKCAMRWRHAVRIAARLRAQFSTQQLITLRCEEMISDPAGAVRAVSAFTGFTVAPLTASVAGTLLEPGMWRRQLTPGQVADVEKVAGEELRRVGYG